MSEKFKGIHHPNQLAFPGLSLHSKLIGGMFEKETPIRHYIAEPQRLKVEGDMSEDEDGNLTPSEYKYIKVGDYKGKPIYIKERCIPLESAEWELYNA